MNRLREAREYLGLSVEFASLNLRIAPSVLEHAESGGMVLGGDGTFWERVSALYHRPIAWLQGVATTVPIDPALLHRLESLRLSYHDRDTVLAFAEFLAHAGKGPRVEAES